MHFGDLDRARRALETSAALAPQFRPPRRYLLGLYVHARDLERAQRIAGQLASLEDGFSIDAFMKDPDYPVSLLRRADMLDISRLREISGR